MAWLDYAGLAHLVDQLKTYIDQRTGASGNFLAAHPPGSYLLTSDESLDPATDYGGTWERLRPDGLPITWHRIS